MGFERIASDVVYEGKIVTVHKDTVRYDDDGEEAEREYVGHPGSVAMVAHDGERVYLVRQPREPVGEQEVLELPAGKLDVEGEDPLATAKRELAEEIGKSARDWELLKGPYYASVGFTNERIWIYLATGLEDEHAEAEENERIEVDAVPLAEIDALIDRVVDGKTLVGLMLLRSRLHAQG
ncbi:MAG TPA: NUDIX hydrolase [Thermoleophilaceae bacterium]|nr:NUDIX hydrolase [Thermoleophilaceae bacterium]